MYVYIYRKLTIVFFLKEDAYIHINISLKKKIHINIERDKLYVYTPRTIILEKEIAII